MALEALTALDQHVTGLAYHAMRAEAWERAYRYLRAAARHAYGRSAFVEAATSPTSLRSRPWVKPLRGTRRPVNHLTEVRSCPLLTHRIVKTGRRVVCRAESERVRFETRAVARYLDTAHLRRVQDAYLRQRADAFRARRP